MDYIKFSYVTFEFGTKNAVKVHVIVEKLLTIFNLAEQQHFTHTQTQAITHTSAHTGINNLLISLAQTQLGHSLSLSSRDAVATTLAL